MINKLEMKNELVDIVYYDEIDIFNDYILFYFKQFFCIHSY